VAVFGIGGVGGHAAEALARCGIGRLVLVDGDEVAISISYSSILYYTTFPAAFTRAQCMRIVSSV
ncbi:MAG: ThiF family adenylyltransferase, partial [Christensenellaceae bacterium]|nr:ThiF family adenylyltransferase [Christensenellaceae bacterium]